MGLIAVAIVAATVLLAYPLFVEFRLTTVSRLRRLHRRRSPWPIAMPAASGLCSRGPIIWLTSPIFGVGFGRYVFASGEFGVRGGVAHNWYMTVLAEQGVVGIALWVLLLDRGGSCPAQAT